MRKNFGPKTAVYPMPVFIVAAYDGIVVLEEKVHD